VNWNLDIAIVIAFLLANIFLGLRSARGIKTIQEYAIGNRNFSTATIASTIVATWIGAGFFSIAISQTYQDGIWFVVCGTGDAIALIIIGLILGPRMKRTLGNLSVAETMGNFYNRKIRIISALASIAISVGAIALQIKVLSTLFNHFFEVSSIYGVIISSGIVILYSTLGGIKSVTFTDVIQFLTFGAFTPVFIIFVWKAVGNYDSVIAVLQNNQLFNYNELINYQNPKFFPYLTLFLYYMIPAMDPAIFQRILIAKDVKQIRLSFVIAALVCLVIFLIICSIGIIMYSYNPNLDPNNLVMHIVDNYSYTGLKGITLVGIMAMIMSTADSYINSASVIFSHDFCKPIGITFGKGELFISRLFAVFIGISALILALTANNLLDLLLLAGNFYIPIVIPPLIVAILGYPIKSNSALNGIIGGIVSVILWKLYFQEATGVDSIIPGMFTNLIVLSLSQYFIHKQPEKLELVNSSDGQTVSNQQLKKNSF
jgi:Na+/proline symporter